MRKEVSQEDTQLHGVSPTRCLKNIKVGFGSTGWEKEWEEKEKCSWVFEELAVNILCS